MMSLAVTPRGRLPLTHDVHGFGSRLHQALGGQHVLDFASADAEGQRAERAVRGSVAIAADDGLAGLGDAKLRADDVHDALIFAVHVEQTHAVIRGNFVRGRRTGLRRPGREWAGCGCWWKRSGPSPRK